MKKETIILGFIIILISSCVKKIDGSSEESLKSSIEEIKSSLSDDKKDKFEESMELIVLHGLDFSEIREEDWSIKESASNIMAQLDGKTADDIIEEGERIQTEIERRKKEQAKIEIEELYNKMKQAENDKSMLKKFEVKRSRYYTRKSGTYYITIEPIIELTVLNGTDKAVSRAYFTGTLASPNRSVPWLIEDFNYQISGGLEPNEEVNWRLAPNRYGKWGDVEAPQDAVLTVEVKRLDGPDGEEMYSIDNFGEIEQQRLEALLSNYPEFRK